MAIEGCKQPAYENWNSQLEVWQSAWRFHTELILVHLPTEEALQINNLCQINWSSVPYTRDFFYKTKALKKNKNHCTNSVAAVSAWMALLSTIFCCSC